MATDGALCSIWIEGKSLEQVEAFSYLGSLITDDAECSKEIRQHLAKGPSISKSLKRIWQNHGISTLTKIRLMKHLYGQWQRLLVKVGL